MAQVPPLQLAARLSRKQISIGGITLDDREHPFSGFELGAIEQQVVVHTLPGGGRVIQTFGISAKPLSWTGILWDSTAKGRSDYLRFLAAQGQAVQLSYWDERYLVVIKEYVPNIQYDYRIDYSITVEVAADLAGKFSTQSSPPSVDSQTQTLYSHAQSLNSNLQITDTTGGAKALTPPLNTLGTNLQDLGPIASATPSSLSTATTTASGLISQITAYVGTLSSALNAGGLSVSSQQLLFFGTRLLSTIQLISSNLKNGQAPKIVQISGPATLYELASRFYGDPTQAPVIQAANSIIGMTIPSGKTMTLKLPPAATSPPA